MKVQTKKFYLSIILSLIALFLISCDNKDKTGAEEVKEKERTLSYYAGNWWAKVPGKTDETNIFTINIDGSITLKLGSSGSEETIPSSSVTRVSNTHYIVAAGSDANPDASKIIFIFSSDTQGKFIMESTDGGLVPVDINITKK